MYKILIILNLLVYILFRNKENALRKCSFKFVTEILESVQLVLCIFSLS